MRNPLRPAVLLICLLILTAGCTEVEIAEAPLEESSPAPGGRLRMGYVDDQLEMDVHRAPRGHQAHYLVYDPLMTRSPDGEYAGHLVADWEIEEDQTVLRLTIRSGVEFHDGSVLDAGAVKENIRRLKAQVDEEDLLPSLVRRFSRVLEGVDVDGELELVLRFTEPFPEVFHLMTLPYLAPMSPRDWEESARPGVVGTGPFKLQSRHPDGTLILSRNPAYDWPPGFQEGRVQPHLEEIILRPYADEIRMLGAFRSDHLDVCPLPDFVFESESSGENLLLEESYQTAVYYLALNLQKEPLDRADLRRALAMAINRERFVEEAVSAPAAPVAGPLAPGVWGYDDALNRRAGLEDDLEAALSLLASAGFSGQILGSPDAGPVLSLELLAFRGGDNPEVARTLANQLSRLGIRVEVTEVDSQDLWHRVHMGEFEAVLLSYSWDEPSFLNRYFHSTGDLNRTGVQDEDLDEYLDALADTKDPYLRRQALSRLNLHLVDSAYFIWLYSPMQITAINPQLREFTITPWGHYLLYDAHFITDSDG